MPIEMASISPPVITLMVVVLLAALAGALLALVAHLCPHDTESLGAQINKLLPQTQCAQCGYPGCAPYAEAIAAGTAEINRCPPGGSETVLALASLLGTESQPLAADVPATVAPQVAVIDEQHCIGCALCLPVCPVDAIVGAHRFMHTVVADECTGCELCIAPCPVDCIVMAPAPTLSAW